MDISPILDQLNPPQRAAVTQETGSLLVLAGAGSGKTRVLVHRIAWLIEVEQVNPGRILAVTFTNKAAGEMRSRLEQLLQERGRGLWVGTFHNIAHRLLRMHHQSANLPANFQIIDSDDQKRAIKRILKEMNIDPDRWPAGSIQGFINVKKDEGLRPQHIPSDGDPYTSKQIEIYQEYQNHCERSGLVDFAELLLRCHELLLNDRELLSHYRQRFEHLLVDEFQDTNSLQYALLRNLASGNNRFFVVGDDDQSIYGWRGAKVENLRRFTEEFDPAETIRLEQNYRSTSTILNAANALITHNQDRLGKNLWCEENQGELIQLYTGFNEYEEADFIMDRIADWQDSGNKLSDLAILYRSHAQSRIFEEALMQNRTPYRVYGGLRFFERAEIKDALAYLRLVKNPNDDASFDRIVNLPPRGIGSRTIEEIRDRAREKDLPLWYAAQQLLADKGLSARALNALQGFIELIEIIRDAVVGHTLGTTMDQVIQHSGLMLHHSKSNSDKAESRKENLQELVSAAEHFIADPEEVMDEVSSFLSHASLEAGETQGAPWDDCVQLMTLHSAKGLEFAVVFLCGLEEGLFPHQMSLQENKLEEERRLCYVGITRARQKLFLCNAQSRRLYNETHFPLPSRFISEIPAELIKSVRHGGRKQMMESHYPPGGAGSIGLGQEVAHHSFGEGVVIAIEGDGPKTRVQVEFQDAGSKWLMLELAKLELL